jgi:hypothetical protein
VRGRLANLNRDYQTELLALAPSKELMRGPWVSCLRWALGNADVMANYRAATGDEWTPGRFPIERIIDSATGRDGAFIVDFARWMNANIWGEVDGRAGNGDEPELSPDDEIAEGKVGNGAQLES